MTIHELIKLLRSDAHYLAHDEIAFNAAISQRISLAADYLTALEAQLVKNEKERTSQDEKETE